MPSPRLLGPLLAAFAALPFPATAQPAAGAPAAQAGAGRAAGVGSVGASAPWTLSAADERALRALAAALDRAWDARDAAGISRLFTADADLEIHGDGVRRLEGDALRAGYQAMLAGAAPALRHRSVVDRLRGVAPGAVLADGRAWIERAEGDSARAPLRAFTTTTLLVRGAGGWQVRAARSHAAPLDTAAWRAAR